MEKQAVFLSGTMTLKDCIAFYHTHAFRSSYDNRLSICARVMVHETEGHERLGEFSFPFRNLPEQTQEELDTFVQQEFAKLKTVIPSVVQAIKQIDQAYFQGSN